MIALAGIILVILAVVGGYLMEHGHLLVLWQPAELVIIGGASIGAVLIANPTRTVVAIAKGMLGVFRSSRFTKAVYMQTLTMMYELFSTTKKKDMAFLEREIDNPKDSTVLSKHPVLLKNEHALHFFCDTLRMHVTGGVTPFDLDQVMEIDMAAHHAGTNQPVNALQTVGEGLPGMGIVAAVLGVVITMGALGGPPEVIGHKVAAALVGTFLGILLCYGFVGPMAAKLAAGNDEEHQYYECLRNGILGFVKGAAPIVAIEQARRTIPTHVRPTFHECETNLKKQPATEAAAA